MLLLEAENKEPTGCTSPIPPVKDPRPGAALLAVAWPRSRFRGRAVESCIELRRTTPYGFHDALFCL